MGNCCVFNPLSCLYPCPTTGCCYHCSKTPIIPNKWKTDRAKQYFFDVLSEKPLIGSNFITKNCANQLTFWQKETFDEEEIEFELSKASEIGFRVVRVYLHNQVYHDDPDGFKERIDKFLSICEKYSIKMMPVIFDDCWNAFYKGGKQPEPIPGVHNSRWKQSPGSSSNNQNLEKYVKDIIASFKDEDLYNEPGNGSHFCATYNLLVNVYEWARKINPKQPLTSAVWIYPGNFSYTLFGFNKLNEFQLKNSDILSFHCYEPLKICSEYMARTRGSTFKTHLPYFTENNIVGKSQSKYPWSATPCSPMKKEPSPWFHDIFHEDGTPYDEKETDLIKELADNNIGDGGIRVESLELVEIKEKFDEEEELLHKEK